jgi:hypothetical protein
VQVSRQVTKLASLAIAKPIQTFLHSGNIELKKVKRSLNSVLCGPQTRGQFASKNGTTFRKHPKIRTAVEQQRKGAKKRDEPHEKISTLALQPGDTDTKVMLAEAFYRDDEFEKAADAWTASTLTPTN